MKTEQTTDRIPAVLVHGWNSHPGIWNRLCPLLTEASVPIWKFDYTGMRDADLPEIAAALSEYITATRKTSGYGGPVDIVCHSVGTCIARYLFEVLDGVARQEKVRQLIGIGPPNNGSALAELFHDPGRREEIIGKLTGVFVPEGFDPAADRIVQDVRPRSEVMQRLRSAGTRSDITYRVIVTANLKKVPAFFPLFEGQTWVRTEDGSYAATFDGDGIVPNRESALPGVSLDIISSGETGGDTLPQPGQYCHINLPRNPAVMERVLQFLCLPVRKQ
ncbi:MAG: alpha/beta fold hydrolase [Methanoregula sp.]|nr:alpha/beta fold hydrolase [Methanoregula sp.]